MLKLSLKHGSEILSGHVHRCLFCFSPRTSMIRSPERLKLMCADGVAGENKFLPVINFNTAADVATVALQRKPSLQSISNPLSIKI